ncbi:hypothetical protein [Truepera radiovictrix]|nr:hypothetical protein [Truepera radiovictrix]WMT56958.1 hypothetical protein RCV51_13180 [Truepera radiovictrix]
MTQRHVDLALLVGIGVLLLALLVLALRAAPEGNAPVTGVAPRTAREGAPPNTPAGMADPASEPTQVTLPEAPGGGGATLGEGQGLESAATSPQTVPERAGSASDRADSAPEPTGADQAASTGTLPAAPGSAAVTGGAVPTAAARTGAAGVGAVGAAPPQGAAQPLERVGFAFGAGSVGACGVPLQPWQHVAVSRDLLERYGCGATVEITLAESVAGRERVVAQVGDTMGAELSGTVNIFVAEDEPAFEYGVTEGTLRPVGSP